MKNGSRLMQLSLKTVYINLPEYIVNGFDLTDHCCDIFYNLFIRQMIGTEKLLYIISVNKFFFSIQSSELHVCSTIITGNLFTETAIQYTVFQRNH